MINRGQLTHPKQVFGFRTKHFSPARRKEKSHKKKKKVSENVLRRCLEEVINAGFANVHSGTFQSL